MKKLVAFPNHAAEPPLLEQIGGQPIRARMALLAVHVFISVLILVTVPRRAVATTVVAAPGGIDAHCGRGYSTLDHDFMGDVGSAACPSPTFSGQITTYSLHRVTTYDQLAQSFQLTVSASFTPIGGSFGADFAHLQESVVSDTGLVIELQELVVNSPPTGLVVGNKLVSSAALNVLKASTAGVNEFTRRFGDEFVISQTYGGRLVAFLEMRTHDSFSRDQLSLSIGAHLGTFSTAAQVAQSITAISKLSEITYYLFRAGTLKQVPDSSSLVADAAAFPGDVAAHPVLIEVETLPTFQAANWPVDAPHPDTSRQAADVATLAKERNDLIALRAQASNTITYPGAYSADALPVARTVLEQIDQELSKLSKVVDGILHDPFRRYALPTNNVAALRHQLRLPLREAYLVATMRSVDQFGNAVTATSGIDQWLGSSSGSNAALRSFSAALPPQVVGLHLIYEVKVWYRPSPIDNNHYTTLTAKGKDGQELFPYNHDRPDDHSLTAIRLWLEGDEAQHYDVSYKVCSGALNGPGGVAKNGDWAAVVVPPPYGMCGVNLWFTLRSPAS